MGGVSTGSLPPEDQRLRQRLLDEAEENGNAVVTVEGDDDGAPYSFSVGAWRRFGLPEAVVIGLPDGMGAVLVNAYVARARAGERFLPGRCYEDFFDGVPVTVERVAKRFYPEYFGSAFLLYGGDAFPALQLIVPTPQGQWPWAPDAPRGFATWQPVLTDTGRPASWAPGTGGP
jgi:hypothetical protein